MSHSFTITCYGLISFLMIFFDIQFSLIVQSCLTLRPHGLQHNRPPCPSANSQSLLKLMSIEMVVPSNYLILCRPLLLLPSIFPSIRVFSSKSVFFTSGGQSLQFQLQHQSFQWIFRTDFLYDWLVGSPCSPKDSQESSPTPQFKSKSFSVLSLPYGPTLTSIHDYWKHHSLD